MGFFYKPQKVKGYLLSPYKLILHPEPRNRGSQISELQTMRSSRRAEVVKHPRPKILTTHMIPITPNPKPQTLIPEPYINSASSGSANPPHPAQREKRAFVTLISRVAGYGLEQL